MLKLLQPYIATKEEAEARMEICRACDSFSKGLKTCGQCGCFMPAKTKLRAVACPLNKWKSISFHKDDSHYSDDEDYTRDL
jgi:hypothetical protein